MIFFPKTSKSVYVSGMVALNIHSPNGTGDWHSASSLMNNQGTYPQYLYIYGEGKINNTNELLGDEGIIDGTSRLNKMGYFPENSPVWIADHPRACVDYLCTAVLSNNIDNFIRRKLGRVVLDDWFPSDADKEKVYEFIEKMEKSNKFNIKEYEILQLWKRYNPKTSL